MHDKSAWHWGFGFGHWIVGVLLWIVVALAIAALLKYLFSRK